MTTNRQIRLLRRPDGALTPDLFALSTAAVPVPGPGEVIASPKGQRLGPDHYVFEFPARSTLDPPFFKRKLRLLARDRDFAMQQMLDVRHIHASKSNNRQGD